MCGASQRQSPGLRSPQNGPLAGSWAEVHARQKSREIRSPSKDRGLFLLCLVAMLLNGCAEIPAAEHTPALRQMRVRTTAYTHTEPGGSKSAMGSRLRFDSTTTSAAADWSWMPVGTRFRILPAGREYVIEDYGSGLIGKKTIDLYMPDQASMRQWGVRMVDIEIIEWGSKAISKMLLARAGSSSKVQRMLASLEGNSEP